MTLQPLLTAPLWIQIHAGTAILAFFVGLYLLLARKGNGPHRMLGYLWVTSLAIAAISSLFIHQIRMLGPYSLIHLLAIWSLRELVLGVLAARRGDIREHRSRMGGLYFGGMMIAGLFTFLPGRIMNRMLFSEAFSWQGFSLVTIVVVIGLLAYRYRRGIRRAYRSLRGSFA